MITLHDHLAEAFQNETLERYEFMAQIIALLVSIAISVAIFYVIGEIRRETTRLSASARTWPPKALHEERPDVIKASGAPIGQG